MLQALIETYLREVGFTTYEKDGVTLWGHEKLGLGRSFDDALTWWMGVERAALKPYTDGERVAIARCPSLSSHGDPVEECDLCPWTLRRGGHRANERV